MSDNLEQIAEAKQAVRERIWAVLEREGVTRFPGASGRIPNFAGAEAAAEALAGLRRWAGARTIKANPDSPQLPVRARALADGKVVFMAVPRLRDPKPFVRLDPKRLAVAPRRAASIRGAARAGRAVPIRKVDVLDLVVCGSVAVAPNSSRVGKGGGYSDLELALLIEEGRVIPDTAIVTTVHPLQVVDEPLPETEHDFHVDFIVTPDQVIRCRRRRRPPGILWDHLDEEKIGEIPALASRTPRSLD